MTDKKPHRNFASLGGNAIKKWKPEPPMTPKLRAERLEVLRSLPDRYLSNFAREVLRRADVAEEFEATRERLNLPPIATVAPEPQDRITPRHRRDRPTAPDSDWRETLNSVADAKGDAS